MEENGRSEQYHKFRDILLYAGQNSEDDYGEKNKEQNERKKDNWRIMGVINYHHTDWVNVSAILRIMIPF